MTTANILRNLAFIGALTVSMMAQAQDFTVKNCKTGFTTTGKPVIVKIDGSSKKPCEGTFKIEGDKVSASDFKMSLEDLDTGIGLRNKHLRENYLDTKTHPTSTFKIKTAADVAAQIKGDSGKESAFTGDLTLKGKTAEIKGTYEVSGKKATVKFPIDLGSFGIDAPSFMGVSIVDKVHMTITFDL